MPTSFDEFDWLLNQGIKSVVTMTENSLPENWPLVQPTNKPSNNIDDDPDGTLLGRQNIKVE